MLYEEFMRAPSKGTAISASYRLIRWLMKSKRTDEENFVWAEQIGSSFKERFGEIPERVGEWLSLLALANDTTGAVSGNGKYAACSSFEYSFYSFKKHRTLAYPSERYRHEFPVDPKIQEIRTIGNPEDEFIAGMYLTSVILVGYNVESLVMFVERYIKESTFREMEKDLGIPRSTLSRRMKVIDKNIKKHLGGYYE